MAFPFSPFALVELPSPGLLPGGLPGELVEGITPRLDTRIPLVGLAIVTALIYHGEVPARSWMLLAPVYRSRSSPHYSWQATEKGTIRVQDEKMVDLLVVGLDLLTRRANCPTSTSINRLLVRVVTGSACNWGWCT
jgi:hypothetical protein